MADFDDFPLSPSQDVAPPPAYEFSQQEYDQKVRVATEQSQQEQEQREQSDPLDEWENWDEALFEVNAAKANANQSVGAGSSSSSAVPSTQSTTQGQGSTKAREAMGQDPYYSSDQYASAAPVRPLSIQKKNARPSSAEVRPEKERPSWYNEAQLGDGSANSGSSGQQAASNTATPRRTLPTPGQLQPAPQQPQHTYQTPQHIIPEEPEDDHAMPPPPFAPVGESLDGPAYERYPGEAQRRASARQVVLTYNGGDLSASPPPSPLQSPVTPVQELGMRRHDTPPRMNSSPSPYQHMQYQAPQASRRPSRQTLAQPPPPPPIIRQQYVPPPPRMDFNPSVAYESSKPSIFGQLPMDTLKRGEGAAALYNSAVAALMSPQQAKSRQPVTSPPRRYAGSISSSVTDFSLNTMYQPNNQVQQPYQQSQQFYGSQDFNTSRASFYPQAPASPIPQYPVQQRQIQGPYPERPMSSMSSLSQGEQRSWSTMQPQFQRQYYQGR